MTVFPPLSPTQPLLDRQILTKEAQLSFSSECRLVIPDTEYHRSHESGASDPGNDDMSDWRDGVEEEGKNGEDERQVP